MTNPRQYKKLCSKCQQNKKLTEFSLDRSMADDLRAICKVCDIKRIGAWRQTAKGKAVSKRYTRKYNHTANGKESRRKYAHTQKGRAIQEASRKRRRIRNPEKRKAAGAMYWAVASGKIPKISSCQCHYCGTQAEHYHHYKGYKPKHWLDVVPTCMDCHRRLHERRKYA